MSRTSKRSRESDAAGQRTERTVSNAAALLANWNSSLAEFYFRRVQKYWLYPLDLAQLGTVDEVVRSLQEFEGQLIADYADQAEELALIARSNPRNAREAPGRDYEASILKAQEDAASIIDQARAQAERIIESARSQVEAAMPAGEEEETSEAPRKAASA